MVRRKRIPSSGCLTVPKEIRVDAGFTPHKAVEIISNEDGSITIKSVFDTCRICGSPDDVKVIENTNLCSECIKKFRGD